MRVLAGTFALAQALALAACGATGEPVAEIAPTGDPLTDAAALLAAAETARDAEARAPLVTRLDAMGVRLADGGEDDPLATWRAEHVARGAVPFRGRALGPAYRRARLGAGQRMTIEQVFYAGERAEIVGQASDGSNVAIAIRNPREERVCAKPLAPRADCRWLPVFTERFAIELANNGASDASVYLVFR